MDLAGEQGRPVVMPQPQRHVAADQPRPPDGAVGRIRVHVDLDGQRLVAMRGQADLVQEARKPQPGSMNGTAVANRRPHLVGLPVKLSSDHVQPAPQIVTSPVALQCTAPARANADSPVT